MTDDMHACVTVIYLGPTARTTYRLGETLQRANYVRTQSCTWTPTEEFNRSNSETEKSRDGKMLHLNPATASPEGKHTEKAVGTAPRPRCLACLERHKREACRGGVASLCGLWVQVPLTCQPHCGVAPPSQGDPRALHYPPTTCNSAEVFS